MPSVSAKLLSVKKLQPAVEATSSSVHSTNTFEDWSRLKLTCRAAFAVLDTANPRSAEMIGLWFILLGIFFSIYTGE